MLISHHVRPALLVSISHPSMLVGPIDFPKTQLLWLTAWYMSSQSIVHACLLTPPSKTAILFDWSILLGFSIS